MRYLGIGTKAEAKALLKQRIASVQNVVLDDDGANLNLKEKEKFKKIFGLFQGLLKLWHAAQANVYYLDFWKKKYRDVCPRLWYIRCRAARGCGEAGKGGNFRSTLIL